MENDLETKELYRKLTDLEKYRLRSVIIAEDFFIKKVHKRKEFGKILRKYEATINFIHITLLITLFVLENVRIISYLSTASVQ